MSDALKISTTYSIRNIFISFLLIGSICIFWGTKSQNDLIALSGPIILMIIYMLIGRSKSARDITEEQYADSIYYLGFMFTLVALTSCLYEMKSQEYRIEGLIGKFGLALVTTIIGLGARIIITNFASSTTDIRKKIEEDLHSSVEQLKAAIGISLDKFKNFAEQVTEQVQSSLTKVSQEFEESISNTTGNLEKLQEPIDDFILKFKPSMDEFQEILANSSQALGENIKELKGEQKKVLNVSLSFKKSILGFTDNLNLLTKSLENVVIISDTINSMKSNSEAFVNSLSKANDNLNKFSEEANKHGDVVKDVHDKIYPQLNLISEYQEGLKKELENAQNNLGIMYRQLLEAANFINDRLSVAKNSQ